MSANIINYFASITLTRAIYHELKENVKVRDAGIINMSIILVINATGIRGGNFK